MNGRCVAVIMAVRNGERYLKESVDSILAQTLGDFELLIVNDASIDGTAAILSGYMDPRIRVFHLPQNVGPAAARSVAISGTRAPYVAIQDADDVALPHRLEKQIAFLDSNPEISLVGSYLIAIDENGREQGVISYPPLTDAEIKWELLFWNPFIHSSVVMRRSVLDVTGLYTTDPVLCKAFVEDYELLSRINRVARSANIPEPLVKYRSNPCGVSALTRSEQDRQAQQISRHNICWLLGLTEIDSSAWRGLRNFSLTWAPLESDEASRAFALNQAIREAFDAKYGTEESAIWRKRRHHLRQARRAFAQFRRNPHLDWACRAVMLGFTAKSFFYWVSAGV